MAEAPRKLFAYKGSLASEASIEIMAEATDAWIAQ